MNKASRATRDSLGLNNDGVGRRPPGTPVDINLCSGAGGLALGLAQVGFDSFDFFDIDRGACSTLQHNLCGEQPSLSGRVFQADLSQLEWMRNCAPVRLLIAGPPCQPFSAGGSRKGHEDERNLFPSVLEAVRVLRPRAILIENVRGLARSSHRAYLDYILRQLTHPDVSTTPEEPWEDHDQRIRQHSSDNHFNPAYNVVWSVFNAADYGVPQVRYRLFIVATAVDLPPYQFPDPTHSKERLLHEQLTGVYWESRGLAAPHLNGSSLPLDDSSDTRLSWVTVRDGVSSLRLAESLETDQCNNHWTIKGARSYAGHTGSSLDWPSKTLKAGVHGVPGGENMLVLGDQSLRYFTLREMARLQSFPDSHYFVGARSNVIRQIGNATPCDLAAAIARPLRNLLQPEACNVTADNPAKPFTGVLETSKV